ncbi:MAG: ABC transporter permease [Porticoccaceae bacterium]|nr:MAG: ABC transporter permease [Porticoccaceae bacterium]
MPKDLPVRLFAALLCALSLAACGPGESNVERGNREGVLHFGNGTEPQELDPHIVTGVPEHNIISALLEGLVAKDPRTLEPVPAVAERWEVSADGLTWRFHLREAARWSNGDPVTAHDFVWSWRRALLPELGNQYAYMLFPIAGAEAFHRGELKDFSQVGVKALDEHTLEVKLRHPTPYFLQLLDHYATFPVHRPTIERFGAPGERGTPWTRPGHYVGNGPFVLVGWRLNKVIEVRKNPYYWDADRVALQGVDFRPVENVSTEERMFRAGQLHMTQTVPIDKLAWYRAHHPEMLQVSPYLGTYYYRLNVRHPVLADARVRRALALAVDRKALVDHVTRGGEVPAFSFTPPGIPGYRPPAALRYDPQEARRLLAEAGYPEGQGFPRLSLLYNTSEGHQKIAVALQQMWKRELGVEIALDNQDWKVFLNSVALGQYEIARAGWIGDYVDPMSFLDLWVTDGGNNQTGWSNPHYDELVLQRAVRTSDATERFRLLAAAERILLEEAPIIPLYFYTSKRLVHPSVVGVYPNLLAYVSWKDVRLRATVSSPPTGR